MTNSASSTKPTNVKKSQAGETQSQLPFFVYGTLRTGQGNWERYLKGNTSQEIPATLPKHKMYSRGIAYVTDAEGEEVVVGNLVYVKPEVYQKVLRKIDDLEGYDPKTDKGHYQRVKRLAEYTDSTTDQLCQVEAWVYHGGPAALSHLGEDARVMEGDWLRWLRTSPARRIT